MRTRRLSLAVAAALALGLSACGQDAEPEPATQQPSVTQTPTADATPSPSASTPTETETTAGGTDTTDDPTSDLPGFSTEAVQDPQFPAGGGDLLHSTVRVGVHDGFDRVVFDLLGSDVPGYRVEYVAEAVDDGSGNPVEVDGDGVLQVTITKTRYPEEGESYEGGPGTYDAESTETVEEVVLRGTFEGMTQAFIGVEDPGAPFRVFTLSNPTRLVVDVQHTAG